MSDRGEALGLRRLSPPYALLEEGFHVFEPDNGLRWTDGDASVPPVLFDGFDGPTELVRM